MTDAANGFGSFGKLVPGFDFLQNLSGAAKASPANMPPPMGNWLAPSINIEELDKRIEELKAVQFWLDQNANALKASIQALEVQKMTLTALKGMNFSMADMAKAFTPQAASAPASSATSPTASSAAANANASSPPNTEASTAGSAAAAVPDAAAAAKASAAPGVVDPVQWWGALTQQFQSIAASAMQDAAKHSAAASGTAHANATKKGAANARPVRASAKNTKKPARKASAPIAAKTSAPKASTAAQRRKAT